MSHSRPRSGSVERPPAGVAAGSESLQISLFDEATLAAAANVVKKGALNKGPAALNGVVSPPATLEGRSTAVWRQWLSSMATDAEAALAAAIAYREMDAAGREQWLSSLEFDAPLVDVPQVALYAPLIAVEQDPERRERLLLALSQDENPAPATARRAALCSRETPQSRGGAGTKVFVLATPLYLDFVQVLACGVSEGRFVWVRHDPIVGPQGVPKPGDMLEGARLESCPEKGLLDELARAVLSHKRSGEALPEALAILGDLLGPLGP